MRKHRMLGCISLSLALLLALSSAAAGTAFSFRNGVTWDTTVAEMMAAEGLQEGGGNYNRHDENGFTFFYLKAEGVYYVYRGDQPVMAYSLLSGGSDAYVAQKDRQTALYGSPADISADTVGTLLNRLIPGSYFADLTTWRLDDGTIAALYTIDGRNYLAYIHEQRILGGA